MLFSVTGCGGAEEVRERDPQKNITVSAAMSLKDTIEEVVALYEKKEDVDITLNLGSSGSLQHQIEQGAPADVFVSAGKKQMDELERQGLIEKSTRKNILRNKMVLITPNNNPLIEGFESLVRPEVLKISIGAPDTVPAGRYARQILESLELWDQLQPKLIFAKNVRQVLHYVETGNVDAGIVYLSDAMTSKKIKITAQADNDLYEPVIYPAALISNSNDKEAALDFLHYLVEPEAAEIFKKYGFTPLTSGH